MCGKARGPEEEADDEVRSRSPAHVESNRTNKRRHTQRSEDHADGPAEKAYEKGEPTPARDAKTLSRAW